MIALMPLAHAGHLLISIPFVAPCFLLVGGLLAMRALEGRRDGESDSFDER